MRLHANAGAKMKLRPRNRKKHRHAIAYSNQHNVYAYVYVCHVIAFVIWQLPCEEKATRTTTNRYQKTKTNSADSHK